MKLSGIACRSFVGTLVGWATAMLFFWGYALNVGGPISWEMIGATAVIMIGTALFLFWPAALYLTWLGEKLARQHAWARTPLTWAKVGTTGSFATFWLTIPLVFGEFMFWLPVMLSTAAAGLATALTSHWLVRKSWDG